MTNRTLRSIAGLATAAAIVIGTGATALGAGAGVAFAAANEQQKQCEAPKPPTPAQQAAVSASYTAAWNNIGSVQDGEAIYSKGTNAQVWATWSPTRPAQQWLQYDWAGGADLTGASIAFWSESDSDAAGNGVAVPKAWKLQSWNGTAWQDVTLKDGAAYPRQKAATNTVEFAAPITTTKLRALFDASTDGVSYAAVGVSEFGASGTVKAGSADVEYIRSDAFQVGVSKSTGGVYHLSNVSDAPYCTNYVMNPELLPSFNVNDSRWVGDIGLRTNGTNRVTGLSDDIRKVTRTDDTVTVAYSGNAANANGIRGFGLTETYALTGQGGDTLDWNISVDNTSTTDLKIENLTIPMLMNSWWNGGDQTGIYEQNVARHSFVAEDGSYAYWQRPNGQGPFLVMTPKAGTSLEFRDKARTGEGPFGESDPGWEGLIEFAIHSEQLQTARKGKVEGYLPGTSETIAAGAKRDYGFTFKWADNYADMRDVLYEAGVVDVVSLPGMVIPDDTKATLAVRAKGGIESVVGEDGKNIAIEARGTKNGYNLYDLDFTTRGPNKVTVKYAGGRDSVLQYNSIAPVEELIDTRADFLVNKQQAKNTGHGYEGAFMQWDMSSKSQITWHNYPGGGWKQWMAGGSDDLGLSPAAFLSEQNIDKPNQTQINALDYYIDKFIWGYMQTQTDANGQRTYRIYHWYDGTDGSAPGTADGQATWRVMNYPHVWNTYFNMYRIAKAYPDIKTALTADEYLMRAYNTMRAYFQHPNVGTLDDASRHMGSMGEMTMPDVVNALNAEKHTAEAAQLEGFIAAKGKEMLSRNYPFASEMSIDTTAFEATYTLAKRYGDDAMANKVTAASMASRGLQPLWYYYGSDNRHMGESWWNLGYETQLGAWQQQDYLKNYDPSKAGIDFDEAMRSTYGAYMAGWSNINTGQISADSANMGAASWQYQSQKGAGEGQWGFMPMLNGWWAWSGEADLGFWGGLKTASLNVVDDKVVGLYGYGGDVKLANGNYTLQPKDGVRERFTLYNKGRFGVDLAQVKYTSATVADDLKSVSLDLERVTDGKTQPTVTLSNMPAGTYKVTLDGRKLPQVTSDGKTASVTLTNLASAAGTLTISQDAAVDMSQLRALVDANIDRQQGSYSNESWETFTDARTAAQKVLADPASTQMSVDQARQALASAIEGLTKNDPDVSVTGIDVATAPTKTQYGAGEQINLNGLTVDAKLSDGSQRPLTADEYAVHGFDSSRAGSQIITVTLNANPAITTAFQVRILAASAPNGNGNGNTGQGNPGNGGGAGTSQPAASGLAKTGADAAGGLMLALMALGLMGAGIVIGIRRRREGQSN